MTKLSRHEQRDKLENLLNEFRLQHVRKSNGDVLSGGERRRTEIARALAVDPKFILLDEPFAGIDPIAVEDIQAIVAKLKYKNIGILITDHNVNETLSICDRAYLLIDGKIYKDGTAEELAADEEVKRLYLGRNFELKRKDYLHEEARADYSTVQETGVNENASTSNNLLVKYAEDTYNKTIKLFKYGENLKWFYNFNGYTFDIKFDEYCKQILEFKSACLKQYTGNSEVETETNKLIIPEYSHYSIVFELENWIINLSFLGIIFGPILRLPFYNKIRQMRKLLNYNMPILGKLSLLLKN
jgi:ABC-type multidrug transport system ATPase subunit